MQPPSTSRWLRCCQLEVDCRACALSPSCLSAHAICDIKTPGTHSLRARLKNRLPGARPSQVRSPEGALGGRWPSIPTRSCPSSQTGRTNSWTWSRTRDHNPTPFASPEGEGSPPSPEGTQNYYFLLKPWGAARAASGLPWVGRLATQLLLLTVALGAAWLGSARRRRSVGGAVRAAREFVEVNPQYTSQECSRCHARNNPGKSETYRCRFCGLKIDRDVNAAINILAAGDLAAGAQTWAVGPRVDPEPYEKAA